MNDAASAMPPPTPARWLALLDDMGRGLLERQGPLRLVLLAALAGEHSLLIGPPGTAKSELARRLHRAFDAERYFERLLTRFSTPEELFGPLSLKALEEDRYQRLVDGFLPTAGFAFLDEVFKANSAILNALLTLLNEREFDNGSGRERTPLVSVVAASNEVPLDEALHAFFDRFLVRIPVQPVSDEAFGALVALVAPPSLVVAAPVGRAERAALAQRAAGVTLGDDTVAACHELRRWLREHKATLSDRRWRQWIGLMRMAAATEGRAYTDRLDLWAAPYVASPAPDWASRLQAWVDREIADAAPRTAAWLTRAVEAFEKQLEIEQSAQADPSDDAAGKLALARSVGRGNDGEAMLRMVSSALEERLRKRYTPVHVRARLDQIDPPLRQLAADLQALQAQRDELAGRLATRVWLPPELGQRWLGTFDEALAMLRDLQRRLDHARQGFAALPQDTQADGPEPAPVTWPAQEPSASA